MLRVNLPVVDTIFIQKVTSLFAGVKIKVSGELKLNDSPGDDQHNGCIGVD